MSDHASKRFSRRQLMLASAAVLSASSSVSLSARGLRRDRGSPVLRTGETIRSVHGRVLRDPYGWVDAARLDDPDIAAFLGALRVHAARMMEPLQPRVRDMMRRAAERDVGASGSPCLREGAWCYRVGVTADSAWALFRTAPSSDREEMVLAARSGDDVPMWGASRDGRFIAYAVRTGPEDGVIRVRDLASGADLPDSVSRARVNIDLTRIVWASDAAGFFYSEVDAQGRPWRAMFHRLGVAQTNDIALFEETDPTFFVVVRQTSSGAFALIQSESTTTSEVRLVPLARPDAPPILIRARSPGHFYAADEAAGALLILTNDVHLNQRLVRASLDEPGIWHEVLAPNDDAGLTWHLAYDRHWIVAERADGVDRIRIIDRESGAQRLIDFPDPAYTAGFDRWSAGPEVNGRADADELILGYQSFSRPRTLLRCSLDSGRLASQGETTHAQVRSADYVVERLFAESAGGVVVPISLLRRADRSPDAHRGLVLYGYGAYGNAVLANFDPVRLGLLDHGVMFALAHVRGGNDKGGAWARAGQGVDRDKPILDFIACARHLADRGYVRRGRIVAEGHSAGAWLAATVVNLAPDLFAGALLHVPYVDVLTDLLTENSLTAASERAVSGDPLTDPVALDRLLRIDPYRTVPERGAPPVFVSGVLTDVRVSWRGIVKHAARAVAGGANPLIASIAESGSHWAPADETLARRWPHERYAFAIEILRSRA